MCFSNWCPISGICQKVNKYNPNADIDLLMQAYEFGKTAHHGQLRLSGEQYFTHALIVADVLSDLKLDTDTLIAALLHDVVEDTPVELDEIQDVYGVALVPGIQPFAYYAIDLQA